jgi:hypothetical protein
MFQTNFSTKRGAGDGWKTFLILGSDMLTKTKSFKSEMSWDC